MEKQLNPLKTAIFDDSFNQVIEKNQEGKQARKQALYELEPIEPIS